MRNIRCDEILDRNEFSKLSVKDFEKQAQNFCIDKMNEYETQPSKINSLSTYPEKKFEIFNLIFENGGNKIFVLDTDLINYSDEQEDKEIYYSRIIAKRICENLKILNEDAIVGISELEFEYKDEKEKIKAKIEELKELDENEYNLDRFVYDSLEETNILEDIEQLRNTAQENEILKEKLKVSENQIAELSNKLKISLEAIEKNRKDLKLNTKSRFESFLEKVKKILN